MPSFSTVNGSYNHFFLAIIDNALDSRDNNNKKGVQHSFCSFAFISLQMIAFSLLLISPSFILLYFNFHAHALWESAHLFWIYDTLIDVAAAFSTFVVTALMISSSTHTPLLSHLTRCHRKFTLLLLAFLLFVCAIYLSTAYLFLYRFPEASTESVFKADSQLCSIVLCQYWTLLHLYTHLIFIGFLPLILFALWLAFDALLFCLAGSAQQTIAGSNKKRRKRGKKRGRGISKTHSSNLRIDNHDLELGLLLGGHHANMHELEDDEFEFQRQHISTHTYSHRESTLHSTSHSMPSTMDSANLFAPLSNARGIKYSLLFGVVFAVLWTLKFFCARIHTNILKNDSDLEYLYYYVLLYTSVCKFVLKRICRKMDEMRIKNNEQNYVFSAEFFMEWYVSVVYFAWFRINIVYNMPSLPIFILIFVVHLSTEIVQSMAKFSPWYFSVSERVLIYVKHKSERNRLYAWLYRVFEDDSVLEEWRNRNALDMVLRLYSSLLISVIQTGLMLLIGSKVFAEEYDLDADTFYTRLYYGSLLIVGELCYYAVVWIYRWCVSKYDIFSSFVLFVFGMSTAQKVLTFFAFFSAVVPSLLQ